MCRPDDTTCLGICDTGITWTTRPFQIRLNKSVGVVQIDGPCGVVLAARGLVSKTDVERPERFQTDSRAGDHGNNRRDCADASRRVRGHGNGRDASGSRRSSYARDRRPRHARGQPRSERSRGGLIRRLSEGRDLVRTAVRQRSWHGLYRGSALVCRSQWVRGRSRPRGGGRRRGRASHLAACTPGDSPPPGSSWLIRLRA